MFDLKRFRKDYGLTQNGLAELLNCSQPYISQLEQTGRELEKIYLDKLYNEYGNDTIDQYFCNSTVPRPISENETVLLPQSALSDSLSNFEINKYPMDGCEIILSPIKGVDFAITVYGDSMSPEYPSGSRVLIKKVDPNIYIEWGKVYVLDTSNGIIIRELHKNDKDGYLTCHAINPEPKYADFEIPISYVYGCYVVLMCLSAK